MPKEPLQIPLKEAAQLLGVRDSRTIRKYGKEGRIRINGTGNGQVDYSAYLCYNTRAEGITGYCTGVFFLFGDMR